MLYLTEDDRLYLSSSGPLTYTVSGYNKNNSEDLFGATILAQGVVDGTMFILVGENYTKITSMSIYNDGAPATVEVFVNGIGADNQIFIASLPTNFTLVLTTEGWTIYNTSGVAIGSGSGFALADGDYGDITVSGGGTVLTVDTGLNANKIADGTVSNAEFQYINSLTSNAQTQLDNLEADMIAMAAAL